MKVVRLRHLRLPPAAGVHRGLPPPSAAASRVLSAAALEKKEISSLQATTAPTSNARSERRRLQLQQWLVGVVHLVLELEAGAQAQMQQAVEDSVQLRF